MSRSLVRGQWSVVVIATLLALTGCATAPTAYRPPPPLPVNERPAHNLRVFDRAWELVNEKFFDARFRGVDWPALRDRYRPAAEAAVNDVELYLALNRMFAELKESHLVAITPKSAHELRTRHRAAVGMRWRPIEGRRVVQEVVPGSPADLAGVRPGWIALARDGHALDDEPRFINEVGKRVTYAFLDADDRPQERTMTAQLLSFERREARMVADDVLYLRFDSFTGANLGWFSRQLKDHRHVPAVIIDLRQNPGGATYSLLLALGELFDHPVDTGTVVRRSGRERDWDSLALFSAKYPGRVAVLVDRSSASSSEIFAHVIQHEKRGLVIGRPTAGAVIVARFYDLPGGGRLGIPVEDYVGRDGRRLEGIGVKPDRIVALRLADLRAGRAPDLETALRMLAGQ
ncbi:MAG: hypothetical protein KIT44_08770 [Opitutaceae bacterium]|nr:hypothetical protein [Opitutaceae bacterium]